MKLRDAKKPVPYYICLSCGHNVKSHDVTCDMFVDKTSNSVKDIRLNCQIPPRLARQMKLRLVIPQSPEHVRFISCQSRAAKRGFAFNLTEDYIAFLLTQPCHYCGLLNAIELDRSNNENGYTVENVVPACRRCNMVKNHHLTYEQMIIVAKALGWR